MGRESVAVELRNPCVIMAAMKLKLAVIFGILSLSVAQKLRKPAPGPACDSFLIKYGDGNKDGVVKLCEFARVYNQDELRGRSFAEAMDYALSVFKDDGVDKNKDGVVTCEEAEAAEWRSLDLQPVVHTLESRQKLRKQNTNCSIQKFNDYDENKDGKWNMCEFARVFNKIEFWDSDFYEALDYTKGLWKEYDQDDDGDVSCQELMDADDAVVNIPLP